MSRPLSEASNGLKRYNLVLPEALFCAVQTMAEHQHVTVLELLRKFIKLGVLVTQAEATPGTVLLLREGTTERELVLL